jgi:hypothetical protein
MLVAGSRHTQQVRSSDHTVEARKAKSDAGLTVEVLVLVVARYSLVEVHISSPPSHLPFGQLSVRMLLTAED